MIFFKKLKIKRLLKHIKSLQLQREHSQPSAANIKQEVDMYHRLAAIFLSLKHHKKYPYAREMAMEAYRMSTQLEDGEAQYIVAKELIEEAKVREAMQKEGILANAVNERLMKQCYEEALAYLQAAVQLNHVQATRLYGLCYIKGFGVTPDQDKGFDYVFNSIEKEHSWDKVPHIFAEMGLNKPEYFSALMSRKKS